MTALTPPNRFIAPSQYEECERREGRVTARSNVRQLLEHASLTEADFVARWGGGALLRLPDAEQVERALLRLVASATLPSTGDRPMAHQSLLMLRAFRDMKVDFVGGNAGRVVIGRGLDVDMRMEDGSVSKHHAILHWGEGRTVIQDCGSLNGTFVNGFSVDERVMLSDGDLMRLGDAYLVFVSGRTLFLQLESVRHSGLGAH